MRNSLARVGWIAFLLLAWSLFVSCGGYHPPQPPPSPPPSPPPPGGAITIQNGDFSPTLGMGCDLCCDNALSAFYDEGLVDGWSVGTVAAFDRVKAAGCKHTVLRLGPFSDVGLAYLDEGERMVQALGARGMVALVSVWDSWAAANGWELYGHTCAVTHGAPPQVLIDYAKQVGARFGKFKNVIFELSNEGFRCNPAPEFESGMVAALRSTFPDGPRLVGSQFYPGTIGTSVEAIPVFRPRAAVGARTGYGDRPRNPSAQGVRPVTLTAQAARPVFDFVTYGAVPIGVPPPTAPAGKPALIEEDDGSYYTSDQWRRFNAAAGPRVTVKHWRGGRAWWEEADFLRHPLPVPGLYECATPPTGQEQCTLKGQPGFTTKYAAIVDAAISESLTQHPELYRWSGDPAQAFVDTSANEMLHVQYVTEGARRRGYCASHYFGDEMAVFSPADLSLSENYDLWRSDGLIRFSGHAATCRPATANGGASDGENGPWSSSPSPIPPTPTPGPQPTPGPSPSATPTPPVVGCPPGAPPLNKIKEEGRRLASLVVDATPMAHDAAFCAGINGQLDCPFGDESPAGFAQRQACEARHAPYAWSFNGVPCDPVQGPTSTCWLNNGNPLQIKVVGPATIMGQAKVCANDGRCWSANCDFDSPVCQ